MNFKKLKSYNGPLTQVTITESEKYALIAILETFSIPKAAEISDLHGGQYYIGHVARDFIKGVK